jgi:hypothetical protein
LEQMLVVRGHVTPPCTAGGSARLFQPLAPVIKRLTIFTA